MRTASRAAEPSPSTVPRQNSGFAPATVLTAFWPSSAEDRTATYPGMRPHEVPAAVACVDREEPLPNSVIKPDAAEIKHTRSRAKPWRANEESATEQEQLSDPPEGGGVLVAMRIALTPFSSPVAARLTDFTRQLHNLPVRTSVRPAEHEVLEP